MTSEQQYYEAKVFLSAYRDALNTLEYIPTHTAKSPPIAQLSTNIRHMRDT